jgi:hypothetical protein
MGCINVYPLNLAGPIRTSRKTLFTQKLDQNTGTVEPNFERPTVFF